MTYRVLIYLCVALPAAVSLDAYASDKDAIEIQTFHAPSDARGVQFLDGSEIVPQYSVDAGALFNFAVRPLVDDSGKEPKPIVDKVLTSDIFLSFGAVKNILSAGFTLPVNMYLKGTSLTNKKDISKTGLGDARLSVKLGLLNNVRHVAGFAIVLTGSAPTGMARDYMGNKGFTFYPHLVFDRRLKYVYGVLNGGYLLRKNATVGQLEAANQILFGCGVELRFPGLPVSIQFEGRGSTSGEKPFRHTADNPLEASGGLRVPVGKGVFFMLGGGSGLTSGIGSPKLRVMASLGYGLPVEAPPSEEDAVKPAQTVEEIVAPPKDEDGDDLPDFVDKCPNEAEDADDFEDDDGCPDQDNDKDGIADAEDGCKNQSGPIENNGCPVEDSDGDGIPDHLDKCPADAEDFDGFEDDDGCPDRDNDKDGAPDATDNCKNEAGPVSNNGCPLQDKDNDGVADAEDRCPETPGVREEGGCPPVDTDKDGTPDRLDKCPDMIGPVENVGCPKTEYKQITVNRVSGRIELKSKITFKAGAAIVSASSYPALDEIAQAMKEIPKMRILIQGHTATTGDLQAALKLSEERAEAVRLYIISKGIAPDRIEAIGLGASQPIASNKTARGREANERIEFKIIEQ